MLFKNYKSIVLLLGLMLPAAWCGANAANSTDGYSHINVNVDTHPNMQNQRPVHWRVWGDHHPPTPGFHWEIHFHIIRVKFGAFFATEFPNQY